MQQTQHTTHNTQHTTKTGNNFILATVTIISEPADAHEEEKKRHSNKIESCGSAAVKTGKGRITSPLRAGGRFGLSALLVKILLTSTRTH